jgi:hypothetical protein
MAVENRKKHRKTGSGKVEKTRDFYWKKESN